jgi:hypothetical protein
MYDVERTWEKQLSPLSKFNLGICLEEFRRDENILHAA